MKKKSTITKEELKIRKFIVKNIRMYNSGDLRIRAKLDQALVASAMLIWVQDSCKWTPLKWITGE